MTGLFRFLAGYYRVGIHGAAPELALNRLVHERIPFWDLKRIDDFTSEISIKKKNFERVQHLASKAQNEATFLQEYGFFCHFRGLKKRKAFVAAVFLIMLSVYVSTGFVWCLRVEGNNAVPSEHILRELEDLGVHFGTPGRAIVSQDLKNRMLVKIPELEWLTVNRSGGLATVVVRERNQVPKRVDRQLVTNMIAQRDCIITNMEVLSGQAVCQPGDTVHQGELLISGYTDLEHCTEATRALGEVYGRTWREQNAVIPAEYQEKGKVGATHRRYALLIGRKRINLYGDSGIWDNSCDKMTVYHPLSLPGGYTFPITLVEEIYTERTVTAQSMTPAEADDILIQGTAEAVRKDMVAGEIVKETLHVERDGGVYRLTGTYECHEMVARSAPAILLESEGDP